MVRVTLATCRLRTHTLVGVEGGFARHIPSGEQLSIYDAAMRYQEEGTPLVVMAGREYGSGSSRDWAAKGALLLGIRAVVAESYERIHRSNLLGMGVLALQLHEGSGWGSLERTGKKATSVRGLSEAGWRGQTLTRDIQRADGRSQQVEALSRIDTANEATYYRHGGILRYVLRQLLQ